MYLQTIDGKTFVFLDVEGFGSTSRSSKDDAKLFALALLSSSLVIYNSIGVINEAKINHLALALSYCEIINSQLQYLSKLPKFVWVLRDFVLDLIDNEGKPITPTQYLEKVLTDETKSKFNDSMLKMRENIRNTFQERECITLPRPINNEEMLQNLNNLPIDSLRPEFVKGIKKVKKTILSACYKQYQNKSLRGKNLIELLKSFVRSLNSEEIPQISSAWENIITNEYQIITERSIDEIIKAKNLFQTKLPVEEEEIMKAFRAIKTKADDLIINCYFRNEVNTCKSLKLLTKTIESEVEELMEMNTKACLEYNINLLNSLFPPLFFAIENNEYKDNFDQLENDWTNVMEQYEIRSKGNAKFTAINEFSKRNQKSEVAKLLNTAFSDMKQQIDELRLQEKSIDTCENNPFAKSNEQMKSAIAYNRYRLQQFNLQTKAIQKKMLRKM